MEEKLLLAHKIRSLNLFRSITSGQSCGKISQGLQHVVEEDVHFMVEGKRKKMERGQGSTLNSLLPN